MAHINERTLLIFIMVILTIATILCLIGLVTPGWAGYSIFSLTILTSTLIIISLMLLIVCIIMAGFVLLGFIAHQYFPFAFVSLLIISSIFMLGAFTSFFFAANNYSYGIMVASFTFTYLSSIIATYWLFALPHRNTNIFFSDKHSHPRLNILT